MSFKPSAATRQRIYARDGGICGRCFKPVPYDQYDVGHIQAQAHGGGHEDSNLRVEHRRCNRVAGQRMRQPGVSALPYSLPSRW